jgi:DNA-directed RNA polymerase subunit N (RpoN/RPB10)
MVTLSANAPIFLAVQGTRRDGWTENGEREFRADGESTHAAVRKGERVQTTFNVGLATMSLFPVCCYTCRKTINPLYEPFRKRVRAIQTAVAEDPSKFDGAKEKDMVAGALSELGIHNLCCRIIFLSFVDTEMDDLVARGDHLGSGLYARTAGELSGTVRVIRGPAGGRRTKPSVLLAR